ncbi:uncharacterized protein LOC118756995 [Rhagoletis pomonella]|uniref:uncharacterized protein LOC118756995 n=1 Tax=Rhagoletis pomonella TaxID=28610 RepID=UPI00177C7BC2|nr:uncharacterized protein LOC118756995 [Rhagoletis pomonella]
MYRQVYVAEQDVDYQRIVWRDDPTEPIRDYRMLRVTYGVAAASHLAVRSLHQSALDAIETHKEATVVIMRDFYMDDHLTGSFSVDNLMNLRNDVTIVLSNAGFELRKWATNCDELREKIPHASKQISHLLADGDEVRTLGIIWNTSDDCLSIAVNLTPLPAILTKRVFLSDSSKVFDPLGLIAPCTILSKIWLQRIWRADVDWDEPVPADVAEEWLSHRQQLPKLTALKLNRWIGTSEIVEHAEYHVFTDASQRAYAAVLYCRTQLPDGTFKVVPVAARAKVAPLKSTTLPRLELCAAHLGAKLVKQVQLSFGCNMKNLYAWTDSTITLAWLQSHPSRWSVFVANRVAAVQEVLAPECWRHVRSEHNPADCASRGLAPSNLLAHYLWWQGPSWLAENVDQWQHQATEDLELLTRRNSNISSELRATKSASHLTQTAEDWELLSRYHSYIKLKRITAYALRFVNNLRTTSSQRSTGALTSSEILHAENALVKYIQTNAFPKEITCCRLTKQIPLRSRLIRLQPFLDVDGILRVGGRIKRASVSTDVKHPIILPKNSSLAKLIISDIHRSTLHAGPQIMQTVLQRRFWVLGSRNLVRAIYHKCVKCKRINRRPLGQVMSDLPSSRLTSSRCFLHSAVDFAGPYFIKFSRGRGAKSCKAYICSFICMSTGAMHLELVGDLSSPAFVAALSRFVNRRGYCQHVYSDNGTNFVGAERELYAAYRRCVRDEKLTSYLANMQITWHFNPPSAPHMGGYWEVGVKRVKYHLKRALGSSLLTYEELATLLTEVEACVNSRPLYWHSASADDLEILTPGHFLIGEPIKALPEPDTENFSGTLHQRWQAISAMRQHFWSRWRNEYVVNLQQRVKWFRPSSNLKEDDVVIIHDSNSPPTKWRLGRVTQCHPGADGLVRVVKLKTADGELVRPIAKLTLLPTQNDIFTL